MQRKVVWLMLADVCEQLGRLRQIQQPRAGRQLLPQLLNLLVGKRPGHIALLRHIRIIKNV
jgi:hypothetical protein